MIPIVYIMNKVTPKKRRSLPKNHKTLKSRVLSRFGKDPALKPFCSVMRFEYDHAKSKYQTSTDRDTVHLSVIGFDSTSGIEVCASVPTLKAKGHGLRIGRNAASKSCAPVAKNINGFIGFRTFYSRMFLNLHQQRLSSVLAKVWATYENKDFWNKYAALYGSEPRKESFTEWLLGRALPPTVPPNSDFFNLLLSCTSPPSKRETKSLDVDLGFQQTIDIMDEACDDNFSIPSELELMYMQMIGSGNFFVSSVEEPLPVFDGNFYEDFEGLEGVRQCAPTYRPPAANTASIDNNSLEGAVGSYPFHIY
ncbi:hypothetical protein BZA70DRAFT_174026 [Myxozyma melibiosi]|uniref:Alpha box domain-containing protein n=1 Tax=Myxozyma melibiosi TaxID=54550 RepID=A0ABR1F5L4_9ASCO